MSVRNDLKFQGYLADAKDLASKLDMENPKIGATVQKQARRRKIKAQFDYEGRDESIDDPEMRYKVQQIFFNKLKAIVNFLVFYMM
jgi:hypothetical protein